MLNQFFICNVFNSQKLKILFFSLFVALCFWFLILHLFPLQKFEAERIAHGGGEYNGKTVTNSLAAMSHNYEKGYRYFEVDLNYTEDNQLVCAHRWDSEKASLLWGGVAPTLKDFVAVFKDEIFMPCTIDSLMNWLETHKDTVLITDIKNNELIALKYISANFFPLIGRIIPQIYEPEDFDMVRSMGYERIMWALYRFSGKNESVVSAVGKFKPPFALVFDMRRLKSGLMNDISRQKLDVKVYLHTINNKNVMCLLKAEFPFLVLEVFTDHLDPSIQC